MSEVGRNDVCPCGSGKKYKKCCINKEKINFDHSKDRHWFKNEVEKLSTDTIISRLKYFGVEFDQNEFFKDVKNFNSAENVAKEWFKKYNMETVGSDPDFIWLAIWVLCDRLFDTEEIICDEQLHEMIDKGKDFIKQNEYRKGCDIWLKAWKKFREVTDYPQKYDSIEKANKECKADEFLQNWVNDIELNLEIAGYKEKSYFQKRIKFCRDVYQTFPESSKALIQNMKKGEAESLFAVGKYEQGEKKFQKLINEYPNWIWGYVGWGDMYNPNLSEGRICEPEKAKKIYKQVYELDLSKENIQVVEERIEDL